jgi:hypothetical protein
MQAARIPLPGRWLNAEKNSLQHKIPQPRQQRNSFGFDPYYALTAIDLHYDCLVLKPRVDAVDELRDLSTG